MFYHQFIFNELVNESSNFGRDVLGHKQIQMTKQYAYLCVSHKNPCAKNSLVFLDL